MQVMVLCNIIMEDDIPGTSPELYAVIFKRGYFVNEE